MVGSVASSCDAGAACVGCHDGAAIDKAREDATGDRRGRLPKTCSILGEPNLESNSLRNACIQHTTEIRPAATPGPRAGSTPRSHPLFARRKYSTFSRSVPSGESEQVPHGSERDYDPREESMGWMSRRELLGTAVILTMSCRRGPLLVTTTFGVTGMI